MLSILSTSRIISWFTADNIVAVTAAIGCITGCLSFCMALQRYYKEKINCEIEIEPKASYHFKNVFSHKPTREGILFIRVINSSYSPCTIHKISVYSTKTKQEIPSGIKIFKEFNEGFKIHYTDKNDKICVDKDNEPIVGKVFFKEQYNLPIRLDPCDAYFAPLFLWGLDTTYEEHLPLTIEFYISNKKFTTEYVLPPLHEVVPPDDLK